MRAALALILLAAPMQAQLPTPPVAKKLPVVTTLHGETRRDDYAWLRDKEVPAVLAYLEAENAYADAWMHGSQELQDALYAEMLCRAEKFIEQRLPIADEWGK